MIQGIVFNVQRYTIHDGPGIRTELFLKGCPLSCKWCGNPESQRLQPEPGVYPSKCLGRDKCGLCIEVCPFGEKLGFEEERLASIDRSLCIGCMKCAKVCPADAIKQWGSGMRISEAMDVIRKDISYYESSGGGVTISGGEPLMQADFTAALLKKCRQEKIHTCLESTFCTEWRIIEEVIPYTDLFITDIKHMDSRIHKRYTGVSNEKILDNLRKLAGLGKPIIVRIPVIPRVNDDMENIRAAADFITGDMGGHIEQLQLLSFMRLGEEKYASLGMPYPMADLEMDREAFHEDIKELAEYFKTRGIHCLVGTKEE